MVKIKKIVSIVTLALAITVPSVPLQCVFGVHDVIQAATVKLNKKSTVLKIGDSTKLKITGKKGKVYWYSDDYMIATVNSKGVVKGVNPGKTWIHANISGKSYKCKVTVKDYFVEKDADTNTTKEICKNNDCLYVLVKNNYKYPEDIKAKCYFYDSNNRPVDTNEQSCYFLETGQEGLMIFRCPDNYSSYEIDYDFSKSIYFLENKTLLSEIKIESNKVDETEDDNEKILITFRNNSKFQITATAIIKYYDSNGNIVCAENADVCGVKPNGKDISEVETPVMMKDDSYITIPYSRYEVILSTVTNDNW